MGRFFDRLCAVAERQFPSAALHRYLKEAALFDFPQRWHETATNPDAKAKGGMDDYEMVGGAEFVMDNFFLPFPVVAVEDTASVIIVADTEPGQVGLNCERVFIECFLMGTPSEEYGYDGDKYTGKDPLHALPPEACMISFSRFKRSWIENDNIAYEAELGMAFCADKKQMYLSPTQWREMCIASGDWQGMTRSSALNSKTALEEIMYFNTPHRFVVKRHAERPRKKKSKGPKFLRSHEREQYVLLQPHEIREKLGMPETDARSSPVPHPRRRHYRILKADRYKFDREKYPDGKKVIVPATWIGPSEGEHGGRRYEVCLDL